MATQLNINTGDNDDDDEGMEHVVNIRNGATRGEVRAQPAVWMMMMMKTRLKRFVLLLEPARVKIEVESQIPSPNSTGTVIAGSYPQCTVMSEQTNDLATSTCYVCSITWWETLS